MSSCDVVIIVSPTIITIVSTISIVMAVSTISHMYLQLIAMHSTFYHFYSTSINLFIVHRIIVSRDQSFTATKSKETRNKILTQENTKDSGMR